jgi:nitrite reductase/ring-hydroxylating ferredoxin subunit
MMLDDPTPDADARSPRLVSRRTALLGAALVVVVGGCAGQDNAPGTGGGTGSGSDDTGDAGDTGDDPVATPTALLVTSAVPVGGGVVLADRSIVVTQPRSGEFRAFTAICTHQGCTVANVTGGTINCPCHGSKFSATDGNVVQGPAERPLRAVSITVTGTTIMFG